MRYFILIFLIPFFCFAHNGKVGYVYPTDEIKIDGKLKDWSNHSWITIGDSFGEKLSSESDLFSRFKVAYNSSNNYLFILTEITDDSFTEDDRYELYINCNHGKDAPSVLTLIFDKKGFLLFKHEKEKDPIHSFFTDNHIEYKISKKKNKWLLEAKLSLQNYIQPYKTIGIDHLVVDNDKNQQGTSYANWGIGYGGFWKQYNSGQLGDIVLLPSIESKFGNVTGKISWNKEVSDPLPDVVNITSSSKNSFWFSTEVDSLGFFEVNIPVGNYYISSSYQTTNPFKGDGYGDQLRIDTNYKKYIKVKQGNNDVKEIKFPLFDDPLFLFEEKGIIEDLSLYNSSKVDYFIEAYMKYFNVPGASIAIIRDGEIVYSEVFGVRSNLTKEPITKNTNFQAASVTKAVFAFIANRFVDRGELDLDKPMYLYLPFNNYEKDSRFKKLTARMVLNHKSGMPNWAFGGPSGWESGQEATLLFEPDEKFSYSGEAFEYLGRVLEKISGKDLNQLLDEEVVKALDIPVIRFTGNENLEIAQGHLQGNPTYWGTYSSTPGVAHSMITEAESLAHFVVALANKKGLSEKQYSEMFERAVLSSNFPTSPDNNYWDLGMGLGFFVQETVAGKAVMHGGSNWDFQAEFVLYPESRNGFVIFTNSNTGHKLGQALGKYLFYGGGKKQKP